MILFDRIDSMERIDSVELLFKLMFRLWLGLLLFIFYLRVVWIGIYSSRVDHLLDLLIMIVVIFSSTIVIAVAGLILNLVIVY